MDCPQVPQLGYSEFSDRLHRKVIAQRIPANGSLELTYRCNFRCQHCYVSHGHTGIPGMQELTTVEVKRIIDEIVEAGCLWLLITGGDPLLRRDFMEIWEYAKRKGLILTLFTNGVGITARVADFLAEWRPFSTEITLYGATPQTYERVTGIKNSFSRVMKGIELLLARNIPLKLKTMVMSLNFAEFSQIKALAEGFGVEFRFDPIVHDGLDNQINFRELQLTPQQVVQLDLDIEARRKAWTELAKNNAPSLLNSKQLYYCSAGVTSFHIDPYGNISPCIMDRESSISLRQASFSQAYQQLFKVIARQCSDQFECLGCALRGVCPQCPAWGSMEHHDPEKRSEYLCEITHLRAKHMGWPQMNPKESGQ